MFDPKSAPFKLVSLIFGVGFLGVLSIPVTLVGLFALRDCSNRYSVWSASRDWIATPAQLKAAELTFEEKYSTKTYRPTAQFEYEFEGVTYHSTRIDFSSGSGRAGSIVEQNGLELVRLLHAGGKTTCLVDPRDPASAVLDNRPPVSDLAAGMSFALPMSFAGPMMFIAACYGVLLLKRAFSVRAKHPNEPWLWRTDWASGRIETQTTWQVLAIGCGWFLFVLFFGPLTLSGALQTPNLDFLGGAILVGVLAVCILLLIWVLYLWRRKYCWGRCVVELANVPYVRGGPVSGSIVIPKRLEPYSHYRVELTCLRTDSLISRNDPKGGFRELWADALEIHSPLSVRNEETTIPFVFHPPSSLPTPLDRENVVWLLSAEAETPGVNLHAQFELPIFDCSNPSAGPGKSITSDELAKHVTPETWETLASAIHAQVHIESDDQIVLIFPRRRKPQDLMLSSLVTIMSVLFGIGFYFIQAPILTYLFPAALLAIGSLGVTYHLFTHGRVRFSSTEVFAERLGLILQKRVRLSTGDVTMITVTTDLIGGFRPHYKNIVLKTEKGIEHAILTEISSFSVARKLAELIAETILPGQPVQIADV